MRKYALDESIVMNDVTSEEESSNYDYLKDDELFFAFKILFSNSTEDDHDQIALKKSKIV